MEGNSSLGIKENIAGVLCYLFAPITSIIFLVLEKSSDFVKFHAMQSLILIAGLYVGGIIFSILAVIPVLGVIFNILSYICYLLGFVCWIIGIINAAQNKKFKFPIVGDIAESMVNKNTPPAA
jgi:uncharacterized membrane protein